MNDPTPRLPSRPLLTALVASSLALTGCAFGNKAEVHLVRSVTFGQEMLDLKRAKDEGALTDAEYLELKDRLMELADVENVVHVVDHVTPGDDDE